MRGIGVDIGTPAGGKNIEFLQSTEGGLVEEDGVGGGGCRRYSRALEASSSQSSVINYTQNEYTGRGALVAAKDNTARFGLA